MIFGLLVLITALTISAVAIYYSIAGLVAIFAAAALPIMVMGGALEVGKLVTAVWLHRYWNKAKWWLRWYLALAVVNLMFITSMGFFLGSNYFKENQYSKKYFDLNIKPEAHLWAINKEIQTSTKLKKKKT